MATLAPLAIKLVANMEKAQKDFGAMSATISSIEKSAKNATPSMKNLTDAVKGMTIMQDAAAKAQEMYSNEPLEETKRIVDQTTESLGTMKTTVENLGQGVSDDILQMKPTISNVQKAQGEIQKLKALHAELEAQGQGGLLADSIRQAEANMAELSNRTVQAQSEANMLKTTLMALNAIPFRILATVFSDIMGGMKTFGNEFNERFGGMPARIVQITAAVTALVVVIGLAHAKTTALGLSTSYFMALWKSSIIYQGVSGFITLVTVLNAKIWACAIATSAWLVAQIGLNVAWTYFLAATGVGLILVVLAAAVTVVTALTMGWWKNKDAIKETEDRLKALEDATQKAAERFRQLRDAAYNTLESLKEPLEKFIDKMNEIRELGGDWKMIAAAKIEYKDTQYGDLLKKQISAIEKFENITKQVAEDLKPDPLLGNKFRNNISRINPGEAENIRVNAEKQLRDSLGIVRENEKLREQADALARALKAGVITQQEYNAAMLKAREQWDPAMKAQIEAAKQHEAAQKRLADEQEKAAAEFQNLVKQFKGMGKTPVESFKELSVDLRRVRVALAPAEFKAATDKLLADLANGLGVSKYLADALTPAQKLAETYRNLEIYAREAGLSTKELAKAKERARKAFEAEADKTEKADANVDRSRNAAIEAGTMAYYEAQNKTNKPLLDEGRKTNRHLAVIERAVMRQDNGSRNSFTVIH